MRWRAITSAMVLLIISYASVCAAEVTDPNAARIVIKSPFSHVLVEADFDRRSQNFAVSSFADDTVTVWPIESPESYVTLRVPFEKRQERRSTATAISPDAKIIALGVAPLITETGATRYGTGKIFIFDRVSERVVRTIEGVPTRITRLRFSPDGRYLAALLNDGCGVSLWEMSANQSAPTVSDNEGYGAAGGRCESTLDNFGMEFVDSPSTPVWLVTSGATGVRTYKRPTGDSAILPLDHWVKPDVLGISEPGGIAIDEEAEKIAVGSVSDLKVAVLGLADLKPRIEGGYTLGPPYFNPGNPKGRTFLSQVAWVRDGAHEWVYAGGFVDDLDITGEAEQLADGAIPNEQITPYTTDLVRWSYGDESRKPVFVPVGANSLKALLWMPKQKCLLVANSDQIGVLNADGKARILSNGSFKLGQRNAADFRGSFRDFLLSEDGKTVRFSLYPPPYTTPPVETQPLFEYNLHTLELRVIARDGRDLVPAAEGSKSFDGALLFPPNPKSEKIGGRADWESHSLDELNAEGRQAGQPTNPHEVMRSVDNVPGANVEVWGTSSSLRLVGPGAGPGCIRQMRAESHRVNMTPDGRTIVVAHSDGTIRWYRPHVSQSSCTLEHLLTLYVTKDRFGVWKAFPWTPTGYFYAGADIDDIASWAIPSDDGRVVLTGLSTYASKYLSKEIIQKSIDAGAETSEQPDPALANMLREETRKPTLVILSPPVGAAITDGDVKNHKTLTVTIGPQISGLAPSSVTVMVDGKPVMKQSDGQAYDRLDQVPILNTGPTRIDIDLPLSTRFQRAPFQICFGIDRSNSTCTTYNWQGPLVARKEKRRLFAIMVGVSDYDDPRIRSLNFAANDAVDFAALLVNDFARQRTGAGTPDYDEFTLNLLLSEDGQDFKGDEVTDLHDKLTNAGGVFRTGKAFRAEVDRALLRAKQWSAEKNDSDTENIFVFFFAGHGMTEPISADGSSQTVSLDSYLLTADTAHDQEFAIESTSLSLDAVIGRLKGIDADKLIVIDACRNGPVTSGAGLDQKKITSYIRNDNVDRARFFFSSNTGQVSQEQPFMPFEDAYSLLYDTHGRKDGRKGNGLFTLAFLLGMTCGDADSTDVANRANRGQFTTDETFGFASEFMDGAHNERMGELLKKMNLTSVSPPEKVEKQETSKVMWLRSIDPRVAGLPSLNHCIQESEHY